MLPVLLVYAPWTDTNHCEFRFVLTVVPRLDEMIPSNWEPAAADPVDAGTRSIMSPVLGSSRPAPRS
jgi:hypothetical protein